MSMTAEQLAQLREVAERATPGDWRRASTRFNGITATPFTLGGEEVMLASASEKRDAEFIAAFNPAVALEMLDEQERKDKRIAELEKLAEAESVGADKAASSGVEWMKRCHAAEKRITELEARTVTVKLPDVERWRSVDAVRAQNAYRVLVIKTLADAGINLTVEG